MAWWIAIYMGTQSAMFYIYASWLAPLDVAQGTPALTAGAHVTVFHIFGTLGSLISPFLLRGRAGRIVPILVPLTAMATALGLLLAPGALLGWGIVAGFMCGASLSISLGFITQRSRDARTAAALSGMSQSFGYLLASLGPILFGWFHETSGGWVVPLLVIVVTTGIQATAGVALRRDRPVLDG